MAISFQTDAELLSSEYAPRRQARLNYALSFALRLPHTAETSVWYAKIVTVRKELKRARKAGGDAGDADVWIIAGAAEHRIPLISHDRQMVVLARSSDQRAYTAIPTLRSGNPA